MSTGLKLSIFSPERRLVDGVEVEEVTLPGSEGEIQVLPGHVAMVGTLQTGSFQYRRSGHDPVFGVISTGFFEVVGDHIQVLAETLELKSEIDVDRARKAQELAQQTLRDAVLDDHQFKKYQLKLQRAMIRQGIASR